MASNVVNRYAFKFRYDRGNIMINKRVIRKPTITKCNQQNNVVVDGYMSSEMLYNEMTKGGRVAIDYIEKLKAQYNEQGQKEIENNEDFEGQLSRAFHTQKEKIEAHFQQQQAVKKLQEAQLDYNNKYNQLKQAEERYNEAMKYAEKQESKPNEAIT